MVLPNTARRTHWLYHGTVVIVFFLRRASAQVTSTSAAASATISASTPFGWSVEYPASRAPGGYGTSFPCGGDATAVGARTTVFASSFPLVLSLDVGSYLVSVLIGIAPVVGSSFNGVLLHTFELQSNGSFCYPSLDLESAAVYDSTQHYATLQVIVGDTTTDIIQYACSDLEFYGGEIKPNITLCDTATGSTFNFTSSEVLANGSLPIKATSSPGSSSSSSSGSGQGPESNSSSENGLGTSTKIAIGVVVPIIVIAIFGTCVGLYRRHQRKERAVNPPRPPSPLQELKPELQGGPYDPAIAGPVKPKAELLSQSSTRSELQQGWPELPEHHQAHELGAGTLASPKRKPVGTPSRVSTTTASGSTAVTSQRLAAPTPQSPPEDHLMNEADLTAEADDLVQELGLIANRKRRLEAAAATRGIKAEEVEGTKGDDYREMVAREERLRRRMDDIQQQREGQE